MTHPRRLRDPADYSCVIKLAPSTVVVVLEGGGNESGRGVWQVGIMWNEGRNRSEPGWPLNIKRKITRTRTSEASWRYSNRM